MMEAMYNEVRMVLKRLLNSPKISKQVKKKRMESIIREMQEMIRSL